MHHDCRRLGVSSLTLGQYGSHERLEAHSQVRRDRLSWAQLAHCWWARELAPSYVGTEEQSELQKLPQSSMGKASGATGWFRMGEQEEPLDVVLADMIDATCGIAAI